MGVENEGFQVDLGDRGARSVKRRFPKRSVRDPRGGPVFSLGKTYVFGANGVGAIGASGAIGAIGAIGATGAIWANGAIAAIGAIGAILCF